MCFFQRVFKFVIMCRCIIIKCKYFYYVKPPNVYFFVSLGSNMSPLHSLHFYLQFFPKIAQMLKLFLLNEKSDIFIHLVFYKTCTIKLHIKLIILNLSNGKFKIYLTFFICVCSILTKI